MPIYHIIDNIYLSNLHSAIKLKINNSEKIDIICRLSEDNNKNIYSNDIKFYNFILEDNLLYTYELIKYSEEINNIIKNNKDKKILIHCNEGQSRSVSIILLYMILEKDINYLDAFNIIKKIKPDINPNAGFNYICSEYSNYRNNKELLNEIKNVQFLKYKNFK